MDIDAYHRHQEGDDMLDDDGVDAHTTSSSDFATVLDHLLHPPASHRRDPRTVRLSAATAALVETVHDRRRRGGDANTDAVLPAELFLCALTALQGTLSRASDAADAGTGAQDVAATQQPLLEVVRLAVPLVAAANPALYVGQFPDLGRTLRGVATAAAATRGDGAGAGAGETRDGLGGINALLRQLVRTAAASLAALSDATARGAALSHRAEKDALKLFHAAILAQFDDGRAKVRKEAHASALELAASTGFAGEQIGEYSRAVLESFLKQLDAGSRGGSGSGSGSNAIVHGEAYGKVMHLLSFLERAMPIVRVGILVQLGEVLVRLIAGVTASATATGGGGGETQVLSMYSRMVGGALSCLVSGIEREGDDAEDGDAEDQNNAAKIRQLAQRVLASLLQLHLPSLGQECRPAHAQCLVSCCCSLLGSSPENGDAASAAIATKLMPLTASTLVELSDGEQEGVTEAVCAELMRWVRLCFGIVAAAVPSDTAATKSVGDCIEALRSLMHHRFRHNWEVNLPALAGAVVGVAERHGRDAVEDEEGTALTTQMVGPAVKGLVRLRSDVTDGASQHAIENAVGIVIAGIGMEAFLGIVSLEEGDGISRHAGKKKKQKQPAAVGGIHPDRTWLLPVLKSASASTSAHHRPNLAFFQGTILALARKCDAATAAPSLTAAEADAQKARVLELWSLLPAFCSNPGDVEVTFPTLSQTLIKAVADKRYPQLVNIIPPSLKLLAAGVRERYEASRDGDEANAAAKDYEIVSQASVKLLPGLFKLTETLYGTNTKAAGPSAKGKDSDMDVDAEGGEANSSGNTSQDAQRVQAVTDAIGELARVCPRSFLQNLFKKVMQRLLVATQAEEDESDKICTLLGLAQALISSETLDESSVSLLYRATCPLIRSDEHDSKVQKRAYKCMAEICEKNGSFVTSSERLGEMTELMIGSIMTCQVSSRHMRLKCMIHIVKAFDSTNEQHMAVIPKIMGEVLLCLKDSNAKTREAAYQLLLTMAEVRDDMTDFFQIILAALGAQTPHMRSGAVMAISRLVFEYRDDYTVQQLLPQVLQTVTILFDEKSREVIKSVVGFVRVSIAAMEKDQLEPLLPEVVGGLMKYNKGKGRFRAKIKIILKKLARSYGFEKITPLVPEDDARLMTHMRKLEERAKRRKAAGRSDGRADGQTVFDDMMESDEEDSDDGRTFMTGATGFTRMTATTGKSQRTAAIERAKSIKSSAKSMMSARSSATYGPRIRAEKAGEIMDMLDPAMAKSVHFADDVGTGEFSDDDDDDGVMEFDDMGRLVVHEPLDIDRHSVMDADGPNAADAEENDDFRGGGKRRRVSKFESAKVERAVAIQRKAQKKANEPKALGSAYKSKKSGGDVKKKGQKFEPYAYVPLDGKSYSKKNRGKAVAQMGTVVKSGKRKRR